MEKEYDKIESDIVDIDSIDAQDIKINPDYYIHSALLKAQQSLTKDNLSEGLVGFRILIEHVETLARAAGMVGEEYEKAIQDYTESKEYKENPDIQVKSTRLANKKIELIMSEVFAKKTSLAPLKA